MRRMRHEKRRDERGAVAIIVAFSLVALLGFTAIALDTGALYAERAQLQNGADAAALAVAQECATTKSCSDQALMVPYAEEFADANANDEATQVDDVEFLTTSSVRVVVSTRDGESGAGALALTFAPILGIDSATVGANASAAWGPPASGPAVLPLVFAPCVFENVVGKQIINVSGSTGGTNCSSTSPSGQIMPGGFSWIASEPAGSCTAFVDVDAPESGGGDTGNDLPNGCDTVLESVRDQTVLLPIYKDFSGTGSNAVYDIDGWAAFTVLGYKFPSGAAYRNDDYYAGLSCTGNCNGLIGEFVEFVSLDDRFKTGGAPDKGASVVSMIP